MPFPKRMPILFLTSRMHWITYGARNILPHLTFCRGTGNWGLQKGQKSAQLFAPVGVCITLPECHLVFLGLLGHSVG